VYRLIQTLTAEPVEVPLGDAVVPAPAVCEDEHGILLLLLPDPGHALTPGQWADAQGVSYVVAPHGQQWATVPAAVYDTAGSIHWTLTDGLPTAATVVQTAAAAEEEVVAQGFVHLHNHTEYSALDGLTKVEEAIEVIKADGQNALGISDHNVVAGHPEFLAACRKAGVRPVLGYEANLVEDRHRRGRTWWAKVDPATGIEYEIDVEGLSPEEIKKMGVEKRSDSQEVLGDYHHLTLWAMNDTGLRNIWAISTIGYTEGFYGRPKIDWEVLERFSEGVIAATGCLRGPLARPYLDGHEEVARTNVARLAEIYGDRLYVEIHSNRLDDQIKVNKFAVRLGREMGLPLLAVTDSHYPTREDDITHRSWLAKTSSQSLSDETTLFAGEQDYHLATEAEVREALSYLDPQAVDEAVENTAVLANRCSVTFGREPDPPNYSKPTTAHPDPVAWDEERLWDRIMDGWERKVAPLGEAGVDLAPYEERLINEEWPLITDKRFCGYFLVVSDYVRNAKFDQKILVGPGRGSGGGCLIAWLTDITELDPVKFDLMFGRFLNPGRTELPDFDVDFPASKREAIKGYVVQRWGEDRTVSIGTTRRVGIRAAIDGAIRVLRPYLEEHEIPGFAEIKAFKEAEGQSKAAAAGTEVTWETFVTEHEDLITGLQERYPLVMAMTENFVGRVDGYGKHPAGVVVSTDEPLTYLPMRVDDEGNLISQFDMNALAALGFTKFDLLTLRTLDTLQVTVDLIRERYGVEIDFYSWNEQYEDPQVWEEISNGNTLGIFQIETHLGTQLCKAYRPASIDDLAAVITLVRPGPRRSGLTDQYLRRRDGKEPVTYVDPRLEEALAPTYGVPIYQEQVMAITMILAGYDTVKADQVRSILGKKKVDKVAAAGVEFVAAAVERGMERKAAETLWAQLAEFAKYGFGKAHAYGYAVLGYWAAWLKFHFPVQFLTACLSTVDNERIPEFVNEARKMGYDIALPDINESGVHFTPLDTKVRYGLADVPGIGEPTAEHIVARQPYTSLEDFRERALGGGGPVNLGHLRALVRIGAFDSIIPNRRAAVMELDAEADKSLFRCVFKDDAVSGPNGLPCTFDWANEPDPPMVARGRGKNKVYVPKPPPARCTKACRNYTPPPPLDPAAVEPYSHDEIMELEKEALGVWLSATPFDRVPQDILEGLEKASQVQAGDPGEYVVAATIEGVRQRTDRTGGTYAFLTLFAQDGLLEGVCFASVYSGVNQHCKPGRLVFAVLRKDASQRLEIRDVIPSE
jgi:DNA polymerase-3 subunit alpha